MPEAPLIPDYILFVHRHPILQAYNIHIAYSTLSCQYHFSCYFGKLLHRFDNIDDTANFTQKSCRDSSNTGTTVDTAVQQLSLRQPVGAKTDLCEEVKGASQVDTRYVGVLAEYITKHAISRCRDGIPVSQSIGLADVGILRL